jgi:hypothetical protein
MLLSVAILPKKMKARKKVKKKAHRSPRKRSSPRKKATKKGFWQTLLGS